jgi:hypothetical protein
MNRYKGNFERLDDSFERLDNALKDYVTDFPVIRGTNYDRALDNAVTRLLEDYAEALYYLCDGPSPDWVKDTILMLADDAVERWRSLR